MRKLGFSSCKLGTYFPIKYLFNGLADCGCSREQIAVYVHRYLIRIQGQPNVKGVFRVVCCSLYPQR